MSRRPPDTRRRGKKEIGIAALSPVIITCAITGAIHAPSTSPHLPVTADEIARSALDAVAAGAASVHLHACDPVPCRPDQRPDAFGPFLRRIADESDMVLNLTSGGAPNMAIG